MDLRALADQLQSQLELETPPVAVRYVTERPAGVVATSERPPAGCSLWRHAEHSTFFADAAAHRNCPVGMFTQGLAMDESASSELMSLVGQMAGLSYLGEGEVPSIATMAADRTGPSGGIVYGPLADAAVMGGAPDAVIMWLRPSQAMIFNEATGGAVWGGAGPSVYGRPACGAIPAAINKGDISLSLGCAGMRTFTEISGDRLLAVIPGEFLSDLAERLSVTHGANCAMQELYDGRKAQLS